MKAAFATCLSKNERTKKPAIGVSPWLANGDADRPHQRDSRIGQALSAAQQSFDMLLSAATGHGHTRGEGVILGYAPNKQPESAT
jgi:hypothetical protein